MKRKKGFISNLLATFIGLLFAFLLAELVLHIYNPLPSTVKGDKIVLRANYTTTYVNKVNSKLEKEIIVSGNSIGFRGPEPDEKSKFKIITVGGSTTQCMYSSNGKTWPAQLDDLIGQNIDGVWLNNAGLNGHSTFGHTVLLKDHVLKHKPDVVLFLIGINDVERAGPKSFSLYNVDNDPRLSQRVKDWILKNSEVIGMALNMRRFFKAKKAGLLHSLDFDVTKIEEVTIPEDVYQEKMDKQSRYLKGYEERVRQMVTMCKESGVHPVLITQPALFGDYTDPSTNEAIGNLAYVNPLFGNEKISAKEMWEVLSQYNQVTKQVAEDTQSTFIDLGSLLPKDSKYFRDWIHFSIEGNEKIAKILAPIISEMLLKKTS